MSTHGYTVMEQPVERDLFQSRAAGIMLVETQQSSDTITHSARILPLPTQAKRELSTTNSTKDKFWLQTRSQSLVPKKKQVLASPHETIEAAFQKLKLKMNSVKRNNFFPSVASWLSPGRSTGLSLHVRIVQKRAKPPHWESQKRVDGPLHSPVFVHV